MMWQPKILVQALAFVFASSAYATTVTQQMQTANPSPKVQVQQDLEAVHAVKSMVSGNVSIIGDKQLQQKGVQNIDDMVKNGEGVDVPSNNMRQGHYGFSIRGISGNRILMTLDDIPLPDAQQDITPPQSTTERSATSNYVLAGTTTRDVVEPDTLKQVHIFKGGNGTVSGDGAVGGSVNMRTYHPADFLTDGKNHYFALKYGYRSQYKSHGVTATAAGKAGLASGLLMLTRRQGHEAENYADIDTDGTKRTVNNKQDFTSTNILFRGNLGNETHNLDTTIEQFTRQTNTDVLHQSGTLNYLGRPAGKQVSHANDEYQRRRFGLSYRYTPQNSWLDEIKVSAYHQRLDVHDHADVFIDRTMPKVWSLDANGTPNATPRNQTARELASGRPVANTYATHEISNQYIRNTYQQEHNGLRADLSTELAVAGLKHKVHVGAEYRQTKLDRLINQPGTGVFSAQNNGTTLNYTADTSDRWKNMPPSDRRTLSVYGQNDIHFENGMILGFGLRYQAENTRFNLYDTDYANRVKNKPSVDAKVSNSAFMPSAALTFPINPKLTGSVSYRRGFRSPDINLVGAGFDSGFSYRVAGNSSLKAETSDNFETGLRFNHDTFNGSFTAFLSKYRHFIDIESRYLSLAEYGGIIPPNITDLTQPCNPSNAQTRRTTCATEHRFVNKNGVKTYGAEAKFAWRFLPNWRLSGAVAYMLGKDNQGEAITNSYPLNGSFALDYAAERWGAGVEWKWAKKNTRVPKTGHNNQAVDYFKAPGYGVFDVSAYYRPHQSVELNIGVNNVLNKKYWRAADVAGMENSATIDRYTQPGRHYHLGLSVKF